MASKHCNSNPDVANEIELIVRDLGCSIEELSGEQFTRSGGPLSLTECELARERLAISDAVIDERLKLRAEFDLRIGELKLHLMELGGRSPQIQEIWMESHLDNRSVTVFFNAVEHEEIRSIEDALRSDNILAELIGAHSAIHSWHPTVGSPETAPFHDGLINWSGPRTQCVYQDGSVRSK